MHQRAKAINRSTIAWANSQARQRVDDLRRRLAAFDANPSGQDGYCGYCSRISSDRIGGAAITTRPCGLCDHQMTFSNTSTDALCQDCGQANGLCRRCGADVELKDRRKPYPFEPSVP